MARVKLKRLTIHEYPNVAPETELTFNDTWNVLLGSNGTGKTTLLKLIAMVVRDDFRALRETAFSIEYALSVPRAEVIVSLRNRPRETFTLRTPRKVLDNLAQLTADLSGWSYRVELTTEQYRWSLSSEPLGTTYDGPTSTREREDRTALSPFDWTPLAAALIRSMNAFELLHAREDPTLASYVDTLYLGRCHRFDESLMAFQILCGATIAESKSDLPAAVVVAQMRGTQVDFTGGSTALWPEGLTSYLNTLRGEAMKTESLRIPQEHAPFLRRAVNLFGFEDSEMILHLVKQENVQAGEEHRTYSNFSFLFTLPGGSQITQAALSYGQKRLLAFLYYVACNDEIIIADELVNGMHYDWIEACLNEIGDRQSFLTSQNPLLLDFLPFASPEEVQKSFIQCSHAPRPEGQGRAQFAWHNLSEEDAATFFRAYEAGVQHVSEILKTKGMW